MRTVIIFLVILLFVLAGVAFGALNVASMPLDLGFTRIHVPRGAAILVALVIGWLLGGVVAWLGMHGKRRSPRQRRTKSAATTSPANDS